MGSVSNIGGLQGSACGVPAQCKRVLNLSFSTALINPLLKDLSDVFSGS